MPSSPQQLGREEYLRLLVGATHAIPAEATRVALFCGDSAVPFSAHDLWDGTGGAEEAVIFVAYELARIGLDVTVYNLLPQHVAAGPIGRVTWRSWRDFDELGSLDALIAWRDCDILSRAHNARWRYCWPHDPEIRGSSEGFGAAHRVLFLGAYQRVRNPLVRDEQVAFLPNGIRPDLLAAPGAKVPTRAVFATYPERGLRELLDAWPLIAERVPGATLDVYYQERIWNVTGGHDEFGLRLTRDLFGMIERLAPLGVRYRGALGQWEHSKVFGEAGVWLYPMWNTYAPETATP